MNPKIQDLYTKPPPVSVHPAPLPKEVSNDDLSDSSVQSIYSQIF